jgi:solute carrier family 25 phosphate transporter 23/24/25/41
MKITEVVSELELQMEETQNQRDKRVEELWKKLDPQGKRELDFKGLKKGLRRIDHRQ